MKECEYKEFSNDILTMCVDNKKSNLYFFKINNKDKKYNIQKLLINFFYKLEIKIYNNSKGESSPVKKKYFIIYKILKNL